MQNSPAPIDPANAAVRELEPAIAAFMSRNPSSVVAERGAKGEAEYQPLVGAFTPTRETIDPPIPELVLDAFVQLRAALDNELIAKVKQSGGDPKGMRFPVADDAAGLDAEIAAAVDRSSPAIQTYLRAQQPYPGGNAALLWATCRLAGNLQKIHDAGKPILAYAISMQTLKNARTGRQPDGSKPFQAIRPNRSEIISELPEEFFEDGDRIEANVAITLVEGQPLSGMPVLQAVKDCAIAVRRTLDELRDLA